MLSLKSYAVLSMVAAVVVITNAWSSQKEFYTMVIYLARSKLNKLVLMNLGLMVIVLSGDFLLRFFFGKLKQTESTMIAEKCKIKLFDIGLTMIYMRDDVTVYTASFLVALFTNYVFHWLAIMRVEYLLVHNNLNIREHLKMYILHALLLWLDIEVMLYLYRNEVGLIYQLLGFQFCFMALMIGLNIFKYTISFAEIILLTNYRRKTLIFNIVELLTEVVKLFLQTFILIYMYKKGILPIPIIYEMVECILTILQRVTQFLESRELENNLKSFPRVKKEDIPDHNSTCLVCLEEMDEGIMLNCGHVFHLSCLQSWIVLKNYCPKCRELIDKYHGPAVVVQKASEVDKVIHERVQDLGDILRQEAQNQRRDGEIDAADLYFHYQDASKNRKTETKAAPKEEAKVEESKEEVASPIEETIPDVPDFSEATLKGPGAMFGDGSQNGYPFDMSQFFDLKTPAVEYGLPVTATSEVTVNYEILRKKFEQMNNKVVKFYEDDLILFRPQTSRVKKRVKKMKHRIERKKPTEKKEPTVTKITAEAETTAAVAAESSKKVENAIIREEGGKEEDTSRNSSQPFEGAKEEEKEAGAVKEVQKGEEFSFKPMWAQKEGEKSKASGDTATGVTKGGLWTTLTASKSTEDSNFSKMGPTPLPSDFDAASANVSKQAVSDEEEEQRRKTQREVQYEAVLRRTASEALKEDENAAKQT